jgi:WD40 repeat protein/serine/threonine protein kinase
MPLTATADLVAALGTYHLLDPDQLGELPALVARFPEPKALAGDLIRCGWLTPFQANQLLQGRGKDLLLGSYVLLERVGEGGMGTVFKARNWKLGRVVALKVIRPERLANPIIARRFEREIRAAARLDHVNVVHAHDAEEVAGTHFLVMEYVEGIDLSRLVHQRGPLPVAEACDCVRQAALGLQHAHQAGLVHRDIKPSNLLRSRDGVVKVLDLGLARTEIPAADETSQLTQEGQMMGTADYLAPEQARDAHAADIRSDLYSLGCTFYYLLTGRVPFPGGSALEKLLRHQLDPPAPLEELRPDVPPDVAAVVHRLMAKRPGERFQTPAEVVEALGARGGATPPPAPAPIPPPAGTPPAAETDPFGRLVPDDTSESAEGPRRPPKRRRETPWLLVGVTGAALVLTVVGAAALLLLRRPGPPPVPPPRGTLTLQSKVPNACVLVLREDVRVATVGFGAETEAELEPGTYTLQLAGAPGGARLDQGQVTLAPGAWQTVRVLAEPCSPLSPWALVSRPAALQGVRGWTIATRGGRGSVLALAYDAGGRRLATAHEDGVVRLLDAQTGDLVRALVGHAAPVRTLAWSPDGNRLASADRGGSVRLWRADTGKPLGTLPVHASSVAWSSDGKTLACGAEPGIVFWDTDAGREARSPLTAHLEANSVVAWSAARNVLALSAGREVQLWEGDSCKPLPSLTGHTDAVRCLAFRADGKALATGSSDRSVRVWEVSSGHLLQRLEHAADPRPVNAVVWSPDGTRLVFTGWTEKTGHSPVYLWDTESWTARKALVEPGWGTEALAWAPDSGTLAAGGVDRVLRRWEAESGKLLKPAVGHPDVGGPLAWSADGKYLASVSGNQNLRFWEAESGRLLGQAHFQWATVTALAWSRDARFLAAAHVPGFKISLVAAPSGTGERLLTGHTRPVRTLAWSPDGKKLASAGDDGTVRLWDVPTATLVSVLGEHQGPVSRLAWSPDGRTLASAGADGFVRLWPVDVGQARRLDAAMNSVRGLAWAPDSKRLAWAGSSGLRVWEAGAGTTRDFKGHGGEVVAVAWLEGGRGLAALGDDATVRRWDVASGKSEPPVAVPAASGVFSPDGPLLLAQTCGAYTVRIWEGLTGQPRGTLLVLRQGELLVAPDGRYREFANFGQEIVHVVETDQGQQTLSPAEFAQAYGWNNDPKDVRLLQPATR